MNKTKFYVYESGELIGDVELSDKEQSNINVLKYVFEKYFGDVFDEDEEIEFDINETDGQIYIGLTEEMYLCNEKFED